MLLGVVLCQFYTTFNVNACHLGQNLGPRRVKRVPCVRRCKARRSERALFSSGCDCQGKQMKTNKTYRQKFRYLYMHF